MDTRLSGISSQNQLLANNLQKHNHAHNTKTEHTDDKVSIGILTPEKTQALLNREIADKLEKYFDDEGIELKGLSPDDFTPEKVSDRILSFVSGRILSEGDSEEQKKLMEQARQGIEQGFAEARDILESLDVLNGQVKQNIDSTYDLLQKGLQRLEDEVNGIPAASDEEEKTEANVPVREASVQNSYSRDENTRVEIITNDGDKILIDLFKQQSAQSSKTLTQTDDGSAYSQSRSISASTGISYQVQGELDEGEQKAIDDLLKDVAKVSDHFFSGNTQQAFKKAMEMDFDSSELTRMSLDMGYHETRSTAISTYSSYQDHDKNQLPATDKNETHPSESAGLKEMSDFINQLDQVFHNPFVMHQFTDQGQGVGDLLNGMNQLLHSDEMKSLEKESSKLLDSLVEQLKERHSKDTDALASDEEE